MLSIFLCTCWPFICLFRSFAHFLKNLFILFILFLAALGFCYCVQAFSSCSELGLLFVVVRRLLIAVAFLVVEHGLQARGLQQLWHMGSVVVSLRLQSAGSVIVHTGLVAPRHVGSSWTRAQTRVPCIGRWILNHCTTREASLPIFYWMVSFFALELYELLLYFGYLSLIRYTVCKYFLPIHKLPFHLVVSFTVQTLFSLM